jgi:hypothetical protein
VRLLAVEGRRDGRRHDPVLQPWGLPFSFERTATVKIDGSVATTPLQYNCPDTL